MKSSIMLLLALVAAALMPVAFVSCAAGDDDDTTVDAGVPADGGEGEGTEGEGEEGEGEEGEGEGCPAETPILCDDDITCVAAAADCPAAGCPAETPVDCGDDICAATAADCPCPAETPVECDDGTCAATVADCPAAGCPVETPVECADGSCVADVADCPCPSEIPVECADGSCVATEADCPLCPPETPVECADGSCAAAEVDCPVNVCEPAPVCTGGDDCQNTPCTDLIMIFCDPTDCTCKAVPPACDAAADPNGCPAYTPLCAELAPGFVMCQCETDQECVDGGAPGVGAGPTCDTTAHYCKFTCAVDGDCAGAAGEKWYCNTATPGYEMCVPFCEVDEDCAWPMACDTASDPDHGVCACPVEGCPAEAPVDCVDYCCAEEFPFCCPDGTCGADENSCAAAGCDVAGGDECAVDGDCTADPALPVCNLDTCACEAAPVNVCEPSVCTGGDDCQVTVCTDPAMMFCDPTDCTCKAFPPVCVVGPDPTGCPAYTPHCAEPFPGTLMCQCENDTECVDGAAPGVGLGPTCDTTSHYCKFTCAVDGDCVGGAGEKWYCNTATPGYEMCLPFCEVDGDCTSPMTCQNITDGKGSCGCPPTP